MDKLIIRHSWDVTWLTNGRIARDRSWVVRDFKESYGITYVHSGQVAFQFDHRPLQQLSAPVAWIYYPGPHFEYGAPKGAQPWDNRHVNFAGERIKHYIETGLFPVHKRPPVFRILQPDRFRSQQDELRDTINRPDRDDDTAVHRLEGLLLLLHQQRDVGRHPDVMTRGVWQLRNDMARNPAAPWDFKTEARRLRLSYSHFRRVFKAITRQPPQQTLIHLRLDRATHLLLQTNRTVEDIARPGRDHGPALLHPLV